MYRNKKIGIVIAAHNEENFIIPTINGLPKFIDEYVVVDDGSKDKTSLKVKSLKNKKVTLLKNEKNGGIGFAAKKGFSYFLDKNNIDIICFTAGDDQFDGKCLIPMIDSIIDNECDYAKSNRFLDKTSLHKMPFHRLIGNVITALLTKFSSGYYSIFDSLNAFSATKLEFLKKMNSKEINDRWDFEISYLLQFAYLNARVRDFFTPIKYGDEVSDMNYFSFIWRFIPVLVKGFFRRINRKYVFYNFHPISLFFYFGLVFLIISIIIGIDILFHSFSTKPPTAGSVMLAVVPFILGFQLILQAIVLDIQNEPK